MKLVFGKWLSAAVIAAGVALGVYIWGSDWHHLQQAAPLTTNAPALQFNEGQRVAEVQDPLRLGIVLRVAPDQSVVIVRLDGDKLATPFLPADLAVRSAPPHSAAKLMALPPPPPPPPSRGSRPGSAISALRCGSLAEASAIAKQVAAGHDPVHWLREALKAHPWCSYGRTDVPPERRIIEPLEGWATGPQLYAAAPPDNRYLIGVYSTTDELGRPVFILKVTK